MGPKGKPFWLSKTVWVNVLTLVISALTMWIGNDQVSPTTVAIVTGIAIPVINVILRFVTDKPLVL